jgi:hypothetical protein
MAGETVLNTKRIGTIIGGVLLCVGVLLLLEGLNIIHGNAMSGQAKWVGWGAWGVAFGAGLLVWANREPRPKA